MSIPPRCDVAIIGGGPAGSMAAAYLARAGYHVVVVDKQHHPRYAVGESLIPDFWRYCDEAGVAAAVEAEGFVRKAGGLVAWQGTLRRVAFKDFGYTRPALHVERDRFDQLLLDNSRSLGAQVVEGVAVHHVEFGPEAETGGKAGVRLCLRAVDGGEETELTCRYVIDASGQAAVIGRRLGLRHMDENFRFMSVWGYFDGSDYLTPTGDIHPAQEVSRIPPATFVTSLGPEHNWGWSWHIMLRHTTSVGLVIPVDTVKSVKESETGWEDFFLHQCETLPILSRLLEPARFVPGSVRLTRHYAYRSSAVAGPGFFLTGDGAGFIDPIFSVGVVLALYSGRAAAWAVERCLQAPDRAADTRSLYTHQLQGRLDLARTLALPNYGLDEPQTLATAQRMAQFAGGAVQSLMYGAALLVNRGPNVDAIFADAQVRNYARARIPTLPELALAPSSS